MYKILTISTKLRCHRQILFSLIFSDLLFKYGTVMFTQDLTTALIKGAMNL